LIFQVGQIALALFDCSAPLAIQFRNLFSMRGFSIFSGAKDCKDGGAVDFFGVFFLKLQLFSAFGVHRRYRQLLIFPGCGDLALVLS
jgi:hypothetical protein